MTPYIIYLHRGALLENNPEPQNLGEVAAAANITLIQLKYRSSSQHKFPVPLHDVLVGYDWLVKYVVHGAAAHNGWQSPTRPGKIGVIGELFGGTLASVLALTECCSRQTGIRGAVICNAITDWTAFPLDTFEELRRDNSENIVISDTLHDINPSTTKKEPVSSTASTTSGILSAAVLRHARTRIFSSTQQYFDPFASPQLFFRTPGGEFQHPEAVDASTSRSDSSGLESAATMHFLRKRTAYRRYPPLHSVLTLPKTIVQVGKENVLKGQGIELVNGMRRSNRLYGLSGQSDGRVEVEKESLEGKGDAPGPVESIQLQEKAGLGLLGQADLLEAGLWMSSILR